MKHYFELFSLFPLLAIILLSFVSLSASAQEHEQFLKCLKYHLSNSSQNSKLTYTPNDPSYSSILNATIMNPRTVVYSPTRPKPLLIIIPFSASQIQVTVLCAKNHGIEVRTRSGGHDSEGLSYVSRSPYVVVDLKNLQKVKVNAAEKTAWVEAGATLGEVYYAIAAESKTLAFPAGICYTVGAGGHFSGGGYGILLRKYGLAADNILDATIVDADGRILNRKSMGKDLFWAIRGGGAASFGVVLAWKIKLVDIPPKITIFSVSRNLEDRQTRKLVHRWQYIAHKMPDNLLLFVRAQVVNSTVQAIFGSVFLGGSNRLLATMQKRFPELGLQRKDCIQTTWIDTIISFNGFPVGSPPNVLLDRTKPQGRPMSFMAKADYVESPVPENVLERLWKTLKEDDAGVATFSLFPYGAKMSQIPESETPFPHRAGNLYELTYLARWDEKGDTDAAKRHVNWTRSVHRYMTPYVSKNPRGAYLNYRDLDLGMNNDNGETSFEQASRWARSYFNGNFERLVDVKRMVDPTNFFKNEQSIPVVPKHN